METLLAIFGLALIEVVAIYTIVWPVVADLTRLVAGLAI